MNKHSIIIASFFLLSCSNFHKKEAVETLYRTSPISEHRPYLVPISTTAPVYPKEALSLCVEGDLKAIFIVQKEGTVSSIKIIESNLPSIFDSAVINALENWRFTPSTINGKGVDQQAEQTFSFREECQSD